MSSNEADALSSIEAVLSEVESRHNLRPGCDVPAEHVTEDGTVVTPESVNEAAITSLTEVPDTEDIESDVESAIEVLRGKGLVVPDADELARIEQANEEAREREAELAAIDAQRAERETAAEHVISTGTEGQVYSPFGGWAGDGLADAEARERAEREAREAERLEMFGDIVDVLKYVKFPAAMEDAYRGTLALWVIHTWTHQYQDSTPYILLTSPVAGSGKSTALSVLASMAHAPSLEVGLTAPNLVSYANDGCTVLIDEADELTKDKQFKAVINSGYKSTGFITRKVGKERVRFSTYSPKAIAGIAREKLPVEGATLDRCIQIGLQRALPGEVRRFRPNSPGTKAQLARITDWVRNWAEAEGERIGDTYPELPTLATSRTLEIWEPLLAVAEALGGDIAAQARAWALEIEGTKEVEADPNAQLVADVKAVLDEWKPTRTGTRIKVADLHQAWLSMDARQFGEALDLNRFSRRLAAFGLKSTPDKGARWYRVVDAQGEYTPEWADVFARYGDLAAE